MTRQSEINQTDITELQILKHWLTDTISHNIKYDNQSMHGHTHTHVGYTSLAKQRNDVRLTSFLEESKQAKKKRKEKK